MTRATYRTLAGISQDMGQIFFASVFVSPLLSGQLQPFLLGAGLLLSLIYWYLSILFANEAL